MPPRSTINCVMLLIAAESDFYARIIRETGIAQRLVSTF